ncbi:rb134 [Citreicella sp. 357]|nr:rb134 [Citreicella sp. 357]
MQTFIRTEGDSLMSTRLSSEIGKIVGAYAVQTTSVGGSGLAGVAARVTAPENAALLAGTTVIWDGSWNGLPIADGVPDVAAYLDDLRVAIDALGHLRFLIIPPILPYGSGLASGTGAILTEIWDEMDRRWPGHVLDWTDAMPLVDDYLPAAYFRDPAVDYMHINQLAAQALADLVVRALDTRGWFDAAGALSGNARITATPVANRIDAGAGTDSVVGNGGADTIIGGTGADTLRGGTGDDLIFGNPQDDRLFGGAGNDIVRGGNGRDRAWLGNGNDIYTDTRQGGSFGTDVVNGGAGRDQMHGGGGDDSLHAGADDDTLYGGSGADLLRGGAGDDLIFGGTYGDRVVGGAGNDTLRGGGGADTFVFFDGDGHDLVSDFAVSADRIELRGIVASVDEVEMTQSDEGTRLGWADGSFFLSGIMADDWDAIVFDIV